MKTNNSKKYNLIENYFENIDTPEKAYILGFICADGGIQGPSDNQLQIKLKLKDIEILQFICNNLKYDGPVKLDFQKNYCQLRITRQSIGKDLSKYGIVPNKTFSITLPKISNDLYKYLILGWFDGDGCICNYVDKKGRFVSTFSIVGNNIFIKDFTDYIKNNLNIDLRVFNKGSVSETMTTKQNHIEVLYKYLYEDHNLGLSRKRDKFYLAYKYAQSRLERCSTTTMVTSSNSYDLVG